MKPVDEEPNAYGPHYTTVLRLLAKLKDQPTFLELTKTVDPNRKSGIRING